MAIRRVQLEDDVLSTVVLLDLNSPGTARTDLFLQKLDVPSPTIREVIDDQVGDGSDDRSLYVGPRTAAVELRIMDDTETTMGQLRPFLSPRRRPRLMVTDTSWAQERRLVLRGSQWPGERTGVGDRIRDVQLQWVVPAGVWEAAVLSTATVAAATGGGDGRVYPLETPRTYPTTSVSGVVDIVNDGELPVPFVARLYGPCVGPRLTNDDTGDMVAFTSELVLAAGEYVEIDTGAQSAYLMSSTDSSVLSMLDFDTSTWWLLGTGTVSVRYNPLSGVVAGSQAVIDYRGVWL